MDRLKSMKDTLMSCVQGQLTHLDTVDTKELGEAIDMIKDLEEAIYYHTITDAMKEKNPEQQQHHHYYTEYRMPQERDYRDMDRRYGKMYYPVEEHRYYPSMMYYPGQENGSSSSNSSSQGSNSSRGYEEYPMTMWRDRREGQSHLSRKNYMESKEMYKDKAVHMKELDKYIQELGKDITEMIEDSSPEEKQMLQQKITALASKIK